MRTLAIALVLARTLAAQYALGPDSQPREGVPQGKVTKYSWATSKIFPGTTRDYWVYVPAQYDGAKPACVMVFQDGAGFATDRRVAAADRSRQPDPTGRDAGDH